ncbi:paraquat-inducible protein A [Spongiibacter sp. KMU-158]|uniref:Paraquat-inducible protein A n=1 Tax=Spongiibacter pelagi TaxID=2760804 RepID=A0A927C1W7_9GAMM|nr:paraquat-inducible protein A [Spongiibacter pelagi]MBD2859770.1 paraquat-inducible protein A [Spongiibacter pelagi]
MTISTAQQHQLARCEQCHKLSLLAEHNCPRCGSPLSFRRPHSLQRCWALCLAATFLLFPANLLPIMTVVNLGSGDPDTIMSGIVKLWINDLQGIAIIVFVASILVPIIKLLALLLLMLVVQLHLPLHKGQCTLLYRFIHFVGRWSMLDLFIISILVTVVQMGNIARVDAGPAATAFAAVVILTMLAASYFDPRLIWDLEQDEDVQAVPEQPEQTL